MLISSGENGSRGRRPAQRRTVTGVCTDGRNIYVPSGREKVITRITPDGQVTIPTPEQPYTIVWYGGYLYVASDLGLYRGDAVFHVSGFYSRPTGHLNINTKAQRLIRQSKP